MIGAGPSGLTVLKNLLEYGVQCHALEREEEVGGNWNFGKPSSSVYQSTHLISSKRMTAYEEFPMPGAFSSYPSHYEAQQYLCSYARKFDLYSHIQFRTAVNHIARLAQNQWEVHVEGESAPRIYAGVIIANGHHWDPLAPEIDGSFHGEVIHSRQFKFSEQLRDKRVLVIGAGNTGCDIAVEAAIHARSAAISMRRGYHFVPKFIRGKPSDVVGDRLRSWPLPQSLKRWVIRQSIGFALGRPEKYGLPRPDHEIFDTHPIINSQLPYYVGHGRVQVFPDVQRFEGDQVVFADDRREEFDLVILATGYKLSFPFIDLAELNPQNGMPRLFLHAFHPDRDDLFVAGMIQPNSGQWPLTELQAKIIARFIAAQRTNPEVAAWFRALKHSSGLGLPQRREYLDSPRHRLEVDYYQYRETLRKLVARMDGVQPIEKAESGKRKAES
ncbi:flavin-containing monooxygenase [Blastopirellula retiformator]|uniref:Putative oxidoreductase CzcO n=1 Tax=Blastopirellula retiformator TaxID=2527970 RepID=A0A5C5V4S3_9BACT|nr:NAD(P)-binding domain-containing protein [Blastopirellula retiformator]TWT32767.1 putative oxidoreductase CzcO [Blastopirellula retiformator]